MQSKTNNFLFVGGLVRDGAALWTLLKAFESVGAKDVEVRPAEEAKAQLLLPPPVKPRAKGPNAQLCLPKLSATPISPKEMAGLTGLTSKQAAMALFNLVKAKKARRAAPGQYVAA